MDRHTDCERCSATYEAEVLLCPLHKAAPDLLAAAESGLAFMRHALEFFGWSAFPQLAPCTRPTFT